MGICPALKASGSLALGVLALGAVQPGLILRAAAPEPCPAMARAPKAPGVRRG
jgi:hypothetical protein